MADNPSGKNAGKMRWGRMLFIVMSLLLCLWSHSAKADSVNDACTNGTWANCGNAVQQWLKGNSNADPKDVLRVANLWGQAYASRFDELRAKGQIQEATPDSEKIKEAIRSKLDPVEVTKDEIEDAVLKGLVKKFLPQLAPVLKFASGKLATVLSAFFDSTEIATDYQELKLMNDDLQNQFAARLSVVLKPNWNDLLNKAVEQAAPQLTPLP